MSETFEKVVECLKRKYNIKAESIAAIHDLEKYGSQSSFPALCSLVKRDLLSMLDLRLHMYIFDVSCLDPRGTLEMSTQHETRFIYCRTSNGQTWCKCSSTLLAQGITNTQLKRVPAAGNVSSYPRNCKSNASGAHHDYPGTSCMKEVAES